jgi:protein phosphatase
MTNSVPSDEMSAPTGPTGPSAARRRQERAMPAFECATRSIRGQRSYQEDTAMIWPGAGPFRLDALPAVANGQELTAVLADGMGGHAGGAIASRKACEAFLVRASQATGPNRERLLAGLEAANTSLAAIVDENPMLAGMGSTLVGVMFGSDGAEWVSVGDSPLLLYRAGEIALLNEDHSLAPELDRLAAEGHMTEDEARRDPRRHMLRSAVTGDEIDLVDISGKPLKLEKGDYVILASDGLQTLEAQEIQRIVAAYAEDGPGAVANALIRGVESMRDPHQDNTTVVAVRIG